MTISQIPAGGKPVAEFTAEQMTADPILAYFGYAHLKHPALREMSEMFCSMAGALIVMAPRVPERTVALRKLLEAKDAAVRCAIEIPATAGRKESFFDRLLVESRELEERKEKLATFITQNPAYGDLPADEQRRLSRQFEAMTEYAGVLGQRIAAAEFAAAAPVEGEVKTTGGGADETPLPFSGER